MFGSEATELALVSRFLATLHGHVTGQVIPPVVALVALGTGELRSGAILLCHL